MRTTVFLFVPLICGVLAIPASAHHWTGHHPGDCYHHDDYCWRDAVQTQRGDTARLAPMETQVIEGTIAEIIYLPGATSDGGMVDARVLSAGKSIVARLAPVGLLKQKQLALREGDTVTLAGYMVSGMDGDLLVATEVRKGSRRVALRDGRGRLIP